MLRVKSAIGLGTTFAVADFEPFAFDSTAFMSGQIGSKLWMCEKLEPIMNERIKRHAIIWVLGGWYGMTNFLLQTRRRANIAQLVSFDIDPDAKRGALVLNETFDFQGTFRAEIADVNALGYDVESPPDIVINTSTEHIDSMEWYLRIPKGTLCVFQSNNMPHEDHVHSCTKPDDLAEQLPLEQTLYLGSKSFHYPTWSFNRYMHIGIR
jgi:hypothetical protein